MIARYDLIVFDMDDTIFDFNASEELALSKTLEYFGYVYSEDILHIFRSINRMLWEKQVKEKIKNRSILRFDLLFDHISIKLDSTEFYKVYKEIAATPIPIDGAFEMLSVLSEYCELIIGSNGPMKSRNMKFDRSTIKEFIKKLYTSEEIGVYKPHKDFFHHILKDNSITDFSKVLVVGDNIETDILGGKNIGVDTCLFNFNNAYSSGFNNDLYKPNYTISELKELIPVVINNIRR